MKSGLWFPLFDELADPRQVCALADEAEEAGWDGFFVWDHVSWRAPVEQIADPWITLAAVASRTTRMRLGPLVTPLARRRPAKVAREVATLDRLSGGRVTLGVGLGSDTFGEEYSRFGEEVDDRVRAEMLDESLNILRVAWTGEEVHHTGRHHTVDGVRFRPAPTQDHLPVWVAGFPGNAAPRRRAARHDGFVPVNLSSPDQLAEAVAEVDALRQPGPFDYAVELPADADLPTYAAVGATWWLTAFDGSHVSVDAVRGVLRDGPHR